MNSAFVPIEGYLPDLFEALRYCIPGGTPSAVAPLVSTVTKQRPNNGNGLQQGSAAGSGPLSGAVRERIEFAQSALTEKVEYTEAVVANVITRRAQALIGDIEDKLERDALDAIELNECPPTKEAIAATLRLACRLAPHLAMTSNLKWGACSDDVGGASLVAQSLATERRLTWNIAAAGRDVSVVCIDEHIQCRRLDLAAKDANLPRELAAWLNKQA